MCHSGTDGLERTPTGPHSNLSMSCGRTTGSWPGSPTVSGDGARPVGRRAGVVASPGMNDPYVVGPPCVPGRASRRDWRTRAVPCAALHFGRRAGWNQRTPRVTRRDGDDRRSGGWVRRSAQPGTVPRWGEELWECRCWTTAPDRSGMEGHATQWWRPWERGGRPVRGGAALRSGPRESTRLEDKGGTTRGPALRAARWLESAHSPSHPRGTW